MVDRTATAGAPSDWLWRFAIGEGKEDGRAPRKKVPSAVESYCPTLASVATKAFSLPYCCPLDNCTFSYMISGALMS
jgi:hypothetical protein